MKRSRGKSLNQEMNLTNMIDVVFAILIVFLISAPLMSQGIKVDLPDAESKTIPQEEDMLKITIDRTEKIFVADLPTDINDFNDIFKSQWKNNAPVVINADSSVHYGIVMKIVSLVQVAGVEKLGFLTLERGEKKIQKRKKK